MKKIITALSILAALAAFTSCNGSLKGDKEVSELKAKVLDKSGNIVFDETSVSGLYQIGVESKESADILAGAYAGSGFDGSNYTRTLSGNKGTVKVTKGTDGVFWSVRFGVEGIPVFTLDIVDMNGENNESEGKSGIFHVCQHCGFRWKGATTTCPVIGTPLHP